MEANKGVQTHVMHTIVVTRSVAAACFPYPKMAPESRVFDLIHVVSRDREPSARDRYSLGMKS
jgi:hypothetical protein